MTIKIYMTLITIDSFSMAIKSPQLWQYRQKPRSRASRDRIMMLAWLMSAKNTASCKIIMMMMMVIMMMMVMIIINTIVIVNIHHKHHHYHQYKNHQHYDHHHKKPVKHGAPRGQSAQRTESSKSMLTPEITMMHIWRWWWWWGKTQWSWSWLLK